MIPHDTINETFTLTRMHSSRMHTAHSSSRWGGGLPQRMLGYTPPQGVGLETPWVWAWRPPQARPLNFPLGCRPGDPTGQIPQLPPWVWAWKPARHVGIPPPSETCCKACWDTTCNACWDASPPTLDRMTDTCKNLTFAIIIRCNNSTRKTRNTIYPPVNATSTMATILTT